MSGHIYVIHVVWSTIIIGNNLLSLPIQKKSSNHVWTHANYDAFEYFFDCQRRAPLRIRVMTRKTIGQVDLSIFFLKRKMRKAMHGHCLCIHSVRWTIHQNVSMPPRQSGKGRRFSLFCSTSFPPHRFAFQYYPAVVWDAWINNVAHENSFQENLISIVFLRLVLARCSSESWLQLPQLFIHFSLSSRGRSTRR